MEAMQNSDLVFFRRSTPSPVPRIYFSSERDDSTNVSSEMIDTEIDTQEEGHIHVVTPSPPLAISAQSERGLHAHNAIAVTPPLPVSAHDERRRQIQNVWENGYFFFCYFAMKRIDQQVFSMCNRQTTSE